MASLVWGESGQRFFETGIDRGVLFPKVGSGVPWDGIISVSESPTGGDSRPYYYDGFKYLNVSAAEEFEATIDAYSAPYEFGKCDGSVPLLNGLFLTQQNRESFGFSYRTRIGNDHDGSNHAYKIHLIYNALAAPSARNNTSINNSPTALTLSWRITTAPPPIVGFRPTAHFVIDSRYTPEALLVQIEEMLYGSEMSESYLPTVTEIMDLFSTYSE